MFIAKIDNGNITVGDYRDLFPNTSFPPSGPSAEFLQDMGCKPVNLFKPHDRNTEKLVPCDPYVEGDWVYTMQVVPMTEEELISTKNSAAVQVRALRDAKLKETDWVVIKAMETGTPVPANIAAERQFLRDIPAQAGFPWDVQWSSQPE